MLVLTSAARRAALRLARGYALSAAKPALEIEYEQEPESSQAAIRRSEAQKLAQGFTSSSGLGSSPFRTDVEQDEAGQSQPIKAPRSANSENPLEDGRLALNADTMAIPTGTLPTQRDLDKKRRASARSLAILKAKNFAKAMRKAAASSVAEADASAAEASPLDEGGSSSSLPAKSSPSATPQSPAPTLEDLLLKRPKFRPDVARWEKKYHRNYYRFRDSIFNAFIVNQLRPLARQLGAKIKHKDPKLEVIERILAVWGWDPPEAPREDTNKVVEQDFELSSAELFLILRDQDLMRHLIERSRVRFSIVRPNVEAKAGKEETGEQGSNSARSTIQGRTILRAKLRSSQLGDLTTLMKKQREKVTVRTFSPDEVLGLRATPEMLQAVSNITGAYVEADVDGTYRASSLTNPFPIRAARRLLQVAALRNEILPAHRSLAAIAFPLPASPQHNNPTDFALLPHASPHSAVVPWETTAYLGAKSIFRMRRLNPWAAKAGRKEADHRVEKLEALGLHKLRSGAHPTVQSKLQDYLTSERDRLGTLSSGMDQKSVVATFGHVVFPSIETGLASALSPPIRGQWSTSSLSTAHREALSAVRPIFIPSLAPSAIHFPLNQPVQRLRKLRYRMEPSREREEQIVMTCELAYPRASETEQDVSKSAERGEDDRKGADKARGSWVDELGDMLDKARRVEAAEEEAERTLGAPTGKAVDRSSVSPDSSLSAEFPQVPVEHAEAVISATLGPLVETDVLLPDRPVDVRFTTQAQNILPVSEIPSAITRFFELVVDRARSGEASDHKRRALVAPEVVQYELEGRERSFYLESEDEAEIEERVLKQGTVQAERAAENHETAVASEGAAIASSEGEASPVAGEPQDGQQIVGEGLGTREASKGEWAVILRTVRSQDQGALDRAMAYAELECRGDRINDAFWRSLADVSRDVPPGAGALRRIM